MFEKAWALQLFSQEIRNILAIGAELLGNAGANRSRVRVEIRNQEPFAPVFD